MEMSLYDSRANKGVLTTLSASSTPLQANR